MSARRPLRRQDDSAYRAEGGAGIAAILMIVTGGALFLALATYTPDDLGSWTGISTKVPPNEPAANFLGPFGATVAGYAMFLLGGAAYLLPFGLLWLGLARINMGLRLLPRPLPGFAIFVLSGAIFLGTQRWWFQDWWREYNILGPGGGAGYLGKILAQKTVNVAGAVIVSLTGYVIGLILMTGIRPQRVMGWARRGIGTAWRQVLFRLSGRRRLLLQSVQEKEASLLAREQAKAERERRRLEKELRRQPADDGGGALHVPLNPAGALDLNALDEEILGGLRDPAPALAADEVDAQPFAEPIAIPAPEIEPPIINGSRRNQPAGEGKLSLAEWRKQQQKPRDESPPAPPAVRLRWTSPTTSSRHSPFCTGTKGRRM